MNRSFGYILNRRPFRDNSLLLDIFTEDYGRICCVARPAKKRGKIVRGNTEPFRYLHLQWLGKGDVQTLTEADERGRHDIPASELMLALYMNELLLLLTRQHVTQAELFSAYKYTLHKIGDKQINRQILMRFEIYLLSCLGYPLDVDPINSSKNYSFSTDEGLTVDESTNGNIPISFELLTALQDIANMKQAQWKELRVFLDKVFSRIAPRSINSRKLLNLS